MQVNSLENRIKLKAKTDLNNEIDAAAKQLEKFCHRGYAIMLSDLFTSKNPNADQSTAYGAIQSVKKAIFQDMIAQREDEAIKGFITKVDELQTQIDELKNP